MGVASIVASSVGAATGLFGGISKMSEGMKMKREAERNIENFNFSELQNPYEGMAVATMGMDYQVQEAARGQASSLQALQSAGARGVVGGVGRVQEAQNNLNNQLASNVENQERQNQQMYAQGEDRIQGMREQREREELAGYGAQLNYGLQQKQQGLANIYQSMGQMSSMFGNMGAKSNTPGADFGSIQGADSEPLFTPKY